jgi:uncharacterized protein YndB with AHSA1/START domain
MRAGERRADSASRWIAADPARAYRALLDPTALMAWLPPDGMSGRLLEFEPWAGGRYRIELSYAAAGSGKTTAGSDVTAGRFLELVPDRKLVQSVEFESSDPAYAGTMIMTWTFVPTSGGTQVTVTATDVPPGITQADHDAGLASSLANLESYLRDEVPD